MTEAVCPNALIVNAAADANRTVLEVLAARGVRGTIAADLAGAEDRLRRHDWDLLILDRDTLADEAHELVRSVRAGRPEMPVIMLSRRADVADAVEAIRAGCDDYLPAPPDRPRLEKLIDSLLPNRRVALAAADQEDMHCLYQIAGSSRRLLDTLELARKAAPTSVPVLIGGESGTGKELISYFIHRQSRRARGPYVRVNCAALSETLLESELFGHERGAFTGAHAQRKGRFELAHGGTLLLDEISETGPKLQAQLLRVLEHQDFERVGGTERIRVNVRVLSTTNRHLARDVERGRFRRDLYYRLGGLRLEVPPLRDRVEDIEPLIWHFVNQYAGEVRRRLTDLDQAMVRRFEEYSWPGNIRQLRNVVRAAVILGEGTTLSLHPTIQLEETHRPVGGIEAHDLSLQSLERKAILEALRRTSSHQAKAARLLGITDRTLREKLRRYRQESDEEELQIGPARFVAAGAE